MDFTLNQKIGFLNLLLKRCDRLAQKHGDTEGCNPQCNELIKSIEKDLKDMEVIRSFDNEKVCYG